MFYDYLYVESNYKGQLQFKMGQSMKQCLQGSAEQKQLTSVIKKYPNHKQAYADTQLHQSLVTQMESVHD